MMSQQLQLVQDRIPISQKGIQGWYIKRARLGMREERGEGDWAG